MNKIIKIKELSKSFGNKKVLDELNLEVEKNTSMVIIGGSGTGKSVLIKSILGLLKPDNGEIYYDGFLLNEKSRKEIDFHSRIGMLFQGAALFDSLPVWENITFGIEKSRSLKNSDWKDLAADKLKKVGLDPSVIYLYPSELSGGMQKRVALARAIARDPELLFFDEPTTGLDPIMADIINNLINEVIREVGATAITITHDMESARKIANNISMLYKGKVIWTGKASEIDNSDNKYLDQFIKGKSVGPIKININD
ncbi:MAG: ABC transporter ATP-binding protein [Alphaproteobacteria bacterium]|uniref:ATP-binding cassette domain-containing protein n=1 Tax=PS1 clade bacterium TaxID=2175152 RepID=A0A368DPI4_9PROT|nr:ABC transporter ATP-binding protein [Rhodobiaceae bacterium]OUT73715.1 MAG: ABC transporter ATP-binding protein [Rhizobiales bacterium TMED25]RCL73747.1 MAG: ATP-binding cassette domain-containing protein [PS1 clade bacterium]|tara:strand:- start:918 stop:1682 length:765 start_codon:yes stop_codon:yes gene_type:complete